MLIVYIVWRCVILFGGGPLNEILGNLSVFPIILPRLFFMFFSSHLELLNDNFVVVIGDAIFKKCF